MFTKFNKNEPPTIWLEDCNYEQLSRPRWKFYCQVRQVPISLGCNHFRLYVSFCRQLAKTFQIEIFFDQCPHFFLLLADCRYESTLVDGKIVKPVETRMQFRTERSVPKVRYKSRIMLRFARTCSMSLIGRKFLMTKDGVLTVPIFVYRSLESC